MKKSASPFLSQEQIPVEVPLPAFENSNPEYIRESVKTLNTTFRSGVTKTLEYRNTQLQNLSRLIKENGKEFLYALYKDLHKCTFESKNMDINPVLSEIAHLIQNLPQWMAPQSVRGGLVHFADSLAVHKDPLGL